MTDGGVERKQVLDLIKISYRNTLTLAAELHYVAVGAGARLSQARRADPPARTYARSAGDHAASPSRLPREMAGDSASTSPLLRLGLGLYIVRQLVEAHGGAIR